MTRIILALLLLAAPKAIAAEARALMDIGATVVSPYQMLPGDAARVCKQLDLPCQKDFPMIGAESDVVVFTSARTGVVK